MDIVGRKFQDSAAADLLDLMARYLCLLRLAPAVDHEAWNRSFVGLLILRNTMAAVTWWNHIHRNIEECDALLFCEERLCVQGEADQPRLTQEMEEIYYRFRRHSVRVAPPLPDQCYWLHHDAAVSVTEGLPVPRLLSSLRPSPGAIEGSGPVCVFQSILAQTKMAGIHDSNIEAHSHSPQKSIQPVGPRQRFHII